MTEDTEEFGAEAPERQVAFDLLKRWMFVCPALALAGGLIWGWSGLFSALLALALVMLNFLLGAMAITISARISIRAIGPAVMLGYLVRLGILLAVVLPIRRHDWFEALAFGIVLLVTHLGLLIWEFRHVSATLARPGLKQTVSKTSRRGAVRGVTEARVAGGE